MTQISKEATAVALLATIIEMSDHAQKLGGATCIAGVAALNRMQTSIQKNRQRMIDTCQLTLKESD